MTYWNVYAKPWACPGNSLTATAAGAAQPRPRSLETECPNDYDGVPLQYYARKETAVEARESVSHEQWAAAGCDPVVTDRFSQPSAVLITHTNPPR